MIGAIFLQKAEFAIRSGEHLRRRFFEFFLTGAPDFINICFADSRSIRKSLRGGLLRTKLTRGYIFFGSGLTLSLHYGMNTFFSQNIKIFAVKPVGKIGKTDFHVFRHFSVAFQKQGIGAIINKRLLHVMKPGQNLALPAGYAFAQHPELGQLGRC